MKVVETRKIDSLGRVVIPLELRNKLDIDDKSDIDICVKDGQIILKKCEPNCKICGEADSLKQIASKDIYVCVDCQNAICALTLDIQVIINAKNPSKDNSASATISHDARVLLS